MSYTKKEKDVLRELAYKYMEIASLPVQREKMEHIKSFNRLDNVPPIITIFQLPWNELNIDGSLNTVCNDGLLKYIENFFRTELYKWENFPVSMVMPPVLNIPNAVKNSGYGVEMKDTTLATDKDNDVVSHSFINQFVEEDDAKKIKNMEISLHEDSSKAMLEMTKEILGDIIPIHQSGGGYVRTAFWDILAELMGPENIYFDLIDRPEFIHDLMERLTTSALEGIEQINKLKVANASANNCHCSPAYTDEFLPDFISTKENITSNGWNCGMAQLFTSCSPEITAEFEIPYISRIAKEFGMFYYGCCERLDDRLDIVQKIPNLKKVSCSPWNDKKKFADNLDTKFIISNKPSPSFLATPTFDEEAVRKDLTETMEIAKGSGHKVEFLLKDISTVKNDPKRLTRWAEIATEVASKW